MAVGVINVSVCSPVHNERENISSLVERVHRTITPLFGRDWEQILVDDGSSDGSAEIISQLMIEFPTVVLIRHNKNQGERSAWSTAFNAARGKVVVLLAADLQSHPEDIPHLLDVVSHGYDVGTGERRSRKDGRYYWLATRILTLYTSIIFHLNVRDVSSSFFAVKAEFLKALPLVENDHRYILAILGRRGARIGEIPVQHTARVAGASHYTRSKVLWAIPEVIRFTFRYLTKFYDMKSMPI